MIDEQTIMKAVNLLLDAAPPGSKVILFGSYARGQADARSDLDFLVVEPEVKKRLAEMVRLRQALQPLLGSFLIPVDVLVVSEEKFDYWRDTPNTVYYSALKEGKVYEQVA
ncbi:MAG: nucleotidyltransferase domain-containing protein [Phycisphaerae bacterium]|nr:nucleotidyltransferase domain-containing protein [Phycisphaerae bacterium]